MQTNLNHKNAILLFLTAVIFFSCEKDYNTGTGENQVSGLNTGFLMQKDTIVLTLRPGPNNGNDAFVANLNREYIHTNYNHDPELAMVEWTVNGQPVTERSFLKFDELSIIPSNATIISARLSLYGLDPNTSSTAPQGNSVYEGSPYKGENGCYIERVIEHDWSEDLITWNNKPASDKNLKDSIPPSTSQWNYDATIDVTNLVSLMVGEGNSNYGFFIRLKGINPYRSILFSSSEAADASKRPKLVVTYKL
ncbi:MAG: DNRLRE domain-containing protein [Parafilimonas sp.]